MTREEIKEYIVYYRDVKGLTFSEIGNLLNISENSDKFNRQYVHQVYKRKKAYDEKYKIREDIKNKVIEVYSNNVIVLSSKVNNSEIIFYDEAEYNEEKDEIKVKRMGITNKYLNEIGLPS